MFLHSFFRRFWLPHSKDYLLDSYQQWTSGFPIPGSPPTYAVTIALPSYPPLHFELSLGKKKQLKLSPFCRAQLERVTGISCTFLGEEELSSWWGPCSAGT